MLKANVDLFGSGCLAVVEGSFIDSFFLLVFSWLSL
jgi:hypothetical protein